MRSLAIVALALLPSCALLDQPVQVVDPETQEVTEVPLGDVIASNASPVADAAGQLVGSVNPTLGLLTAGAIGTLLAGARRKKKPIA